MKTLYRIDYADGRASTPCDSYTDALIFLDALGDEIEVGHDGDIMDGGARTLAWLCPEDAQDDDGARAFASIVVVTP